MAQMDKVSLPEWDTVGKGNESPMQLFINIIHQNGYQAVCLMVIFI